MANVISLEIKRPVVLGILSLTAAFILLLIVFRQPIPAKKFLSNDIYYIWEDGRDIANGINPYSKIHGSNMRQNKKYSTYLPGFFILASIYVSQVNDQFFEFLNDWRPISFLIHFTIGIVLFFYLLTKGNFWLAFFGSNFWLLSRWPIGVMLSGQIDLLAILLLLLSLMMFEKSRRLSLILFGASLSIKQIGIFMLPVYILLECNSANSFRWNFKQSINSLFYILIIPFLVCLPFIVWDAKGMFLSILFSATRLPGGHIPMISLDSHLNLVGLPAKIPMLAMLAAVYFQVLHKNIGKFTAALAVFLVFISFNSVLFKQYTPWFCAFLACSMLEYVNAKRYS